MKKLLTIASVAAATVAAGSVVTACGTSTVKLNDANADKVTIWSPFANTGTNTKAHEELLKLVNAYNTANPTEAQVEVITIEGSYNGVASKLELDAKANAGLPNLWLGYADSAAMLNTYESLQDIEAIKDGGKSIVTSSLWVNDFIAEGKSVSGQLNGIPYQKSAEVGFVNMALVKAVMGAVNADSVDATAPKFWNIQKTTNFSTWLNDVSNVSVEIDQTVTKLTGTEQLKWADLDSMAGMLKISNIFKNFKVKANGVDTLAFGADSLSNYGMAQTFNAAEHNYNNYFLNAGKNGAEIQLNKGENALKTAFGAYRDIMATGRGWSSTGKDYSSDLFKANKMAMAAGSTAGAAYQVGGGTLAKDVYITTVPTISTSKETVVQQGPSMWMTNVGSDAVNKSTAKFLQFSAGLEYQTSMAMNTGYFPTTKEAFGANTDFIKSLDTKVAAIENGTSTLSEGQKLAAITQKSFVGLIDRAEKNANTILFVPPVNSKTNALRNSVVQLAYTELFAKVKEGTAVSNDEFWATIKSKFNEYVA